MILFLLPEVVNTVRIYEDWYTSQNTAVRLRCVLKDLDDFGHFDSRAESE